jgi:hypothetical protein
MKTAIIVSGIFRHIEDAMPSWMFDGDYFLITQDTYQLPRDTSEEHSILHELEKCKDKFKAVIVLDKIPAEFEYGTTLINQTWKWKIIYNFLVPYIEKYNYERFIIIRPDSYLHVFGNIDELKIEPNILHSTSVVSRDDAGFIFANDTFMICKKDVLKVISNFYDYIEPISHIGSIHEHLANYLNLKNITVTAEVLKHVQTFQLRPGLEHMFENNKLKDKYVVNDLYKGIQEWKKD